MNDQRGSWELPAMLSYIRSWLRALPWIVGGSVLVGGAVGIWQIFQPEEYLCEVEFVPPSLEHLAFHPPRFVPAEPMDMERFYSYLQSPALWGEVADSFQLFRHYGIDHISNPRRRQRALEAELRERISYRITKNSTLYLSVLDQDPEYAYKIATFVLDKVRMQIEKFTQESRVKSMAFSDDTIIAKKLDEIQEKLIPLRQKYDLLTFLSTGTVRWNLNPASREVISHSAAEALSRYDELLVLDREQSALTEIKARLRAHLTERAYYFSLYNEKLWLILPPLRPIAPTYPRPLRWGVITGAITFILLSVANLYRHQLRRLRALYTLQQVS